MNTDWLPSYTIPLIVLVVGALSFPISAFIGKMIKRGMASGGEVPQPPTRRGPASGQVFYLGTAPNGDRIYRAVNDPDGPYLVVPAEDGE